MSASGIVERRRGASIRYTGLPLPTFPAKFREIAQEELQETVFYWRRRFGHTHFTRSAYGAYGGKEERVYDRRYKRSRRGEGKGQVRPPLIHSGKLKRAFLQGACKPRRAVPAQG